MKIKRNDIPVMTIQRFAEENDLTMEIHERRVPVDNPARYYAHFEHCDVKGDGVLIGAYGDGRTPEGAIANYARRIELGRLVIDAGTPQRREISVPRLLASAAGS